MQEIIVPRQKVKLISKKNIHQSISVPKLKLRMLNHWDNLNRTVERGYAGFSIWDWHRLPTFIDQRYIDYARANASIGINAVALTNVNANSIILTPAYLEKVKKLDNDPAVQSTADSYLQELKVK